MNLKQLLTEAEDNHWTIGVCAQIINDKREVLLVQRSTSDWCAGVWEMPGGGKENDEDITDCLRREVQEETGLEIISEPKLIGYFDFRHSENATIKRKFCFQISSTSGTIKLSPDHSEHKYFSLAEIQAMKVEDESGNAYELFRDHYLLLVKSLKEVTN